MLGLLQLWFVPFIWKRGSFCLLWTLQEHGCIGGRYAQHNLRKFLWKLLRMWTLSYRIANLESWLSSSYIGSQHRLKLLLSKRLKYSMWLKSGLLKPLWDWIRYHYLLDSWRMISNSARASYQRKSKNLYSTLVRSKRSTRSWDFQSFCEKGLHL